MGIFGDILNIPATIIGGVTGSILGVSAVLIGETLGITLRMVNEALEAGCKTYDEIKRFHNL